MLSRAKGFTLVEMIVVIVIVGIVGSMVAIFIRAPLQGYSDSSRRAQLSDIADTALRRLARDVRVAVPNSIRLPNPSGVNTYIEFLPTSAGGRYRYDPAGGAGTLCSAVTGNTSGDALSFDGSDTCFEIIGPPLVLKSGDQIVVGSTQSTGNLPYDSSASGLRRPYTGAAGAVQMIVFSGGQWPVYAQLASQRFVVVPAAQQAVTYACVGTLGTLDSNNNGQARLVRYWAYGYNTVQSAPPLAGSSAILADNVSSCEIGYGLVSQRDGLVTMRLGLTRGGENLSLYHEIHIDNSP